MASERASGEGVRLVAVDRPGFGRSDYRAGRSRLDWPDDVVPAAHSHYLCNNAPYASSFFWPEEGHSSLVVDHADEIFRNRDRCRHSTRGT